VALAVDASIAGMMGLVAAACFAVTLLFAPRHGLLADALRRRTRRRAVRAELART
jgi:manganese/zinc/iron transport system permease protein